MPRETTAGESSLRLGAVCSLEGGAEVTEHRGVGNLRPNGAVRLGYLLLASGPPETELGITSPIQF